MCTSANEELGTLAENNPLTNSVLPLVEGGCETRLPTAALASLDWRVRLAAVSAGGLSGDASWCTGEALPCWLLDATTVMERACTG